MVYTWISANILRAIGSQTQKKTHCIILSLSLPTLANLNHGERSHEDDYFGEDCMDGPRLGSFMGAG